MPARNMLVQLLALYTNPENQNAQRQRQTDGQTDDRITPVADRRRHTVTQASKQVACIERDNCTQLNNIKVRCTKNT